MEALFLNVKLSVCLFLFLANSVSGQCADKLNGDNYLMVRILQAGNRPVPDLIMWKMVY